MAGCAEEDSGSEEGPARPLPRPAAAGKVVRVLTVLAYLLSVSLAAILLSVYYVYVWQSPDLPPEPGAAARRSDYHHHHARLALQDLPEHRFNDDGGGNSTMRTNYTQESPYNETVSDDRSDDASTDQPAAAPPRSSTDTT